MTKAASRRKPKPATDLTLAARYLTQCIEQSGATRTQIAKILGVTPGAITRYTTGQTEIPMDLARAMSLLGWNPIVLCPTIRRALDIVSMMPDDTSNHFKLGD